MSQQLYNVIWLKRALKQLQQFEKQTQVNIVRKVRLLSRNDASTDTKKLQGHENLYRMRIGDYQVVYYLDKEKKQCLISEIAHRKEIYRSY